METLSINIGDLLHLQLVEGKKNLRGDVQFIGCVPGQFIFVSMPKEEDFLRKIVVSDEFAVRFMDGKNILAFKSRVLKIFEDATPFLQLSYPASIEKVEIRKTERIPVKLDTSISACGQSLDGTINNLSASGAMLMTSTPLGNLNDGVEIRFEVKFGTLNNTIDTQAVIRNIGEPFSDSATDILYYRYGVEFNALDEAHVLYIQGYIYEQMAIQRISAHA